jgi:hypothetical protein
MGLDMYARAVAPKDAISPISYKQDAEGHELHYWRKHHDLHGWMEQLYHKKGGEKEFNCEVVELTEEDLDNLTNALDFKQLPETTCFFFGNNPPDEESKKDDLEFIQKARDAIRDGFKVYYSSWW